MSWRDSSVTQLGWSLLLVVLVSARSADAQTDGRDSSSRLEESCSYIKCRLTIVRTPLGGERLLVGSLGRSEKLGFAGSAVSRSVAAFPPALASANAGREPRIMARALLYSGLAAFGYLTAQRMLTRRGLPVLSPFVGFAEGAGRGLMIAVPAFLLSIPIERRANKHFDRAVSLYNEQLPR